ncbi:hypothetical protein GCM10011410_26340 [Hoyosella rhizosphaerae]|uniref:Uncharacterized protein n=1 Tax=Hoyosella rhizosphaerae TaxID=1755582 RepID=A0A916UGJ3_9ACTN|nr:hypothetical protein GCM10011410_26340 [Hoyosella rhizosphaerae]
MAHLPPAKESDMAHYAGARYRGIRHIGTQATNLRTKRELAERDSPGQHDQHQQGQQH